MTILFRILLSPLLNGLLLFTVAAGAIAASPQLAAQQRAAAMSPVTISITTTAGTVWGTVTAAYTFRHHTTSRACTTARCTLQIPRGAMLRLKQTAKDSTTWPFKDWQVRASHGSRTMQTHAITIKVTGSMAVTAVYVVAGTQSSSYGSGSNYP